MYTSLGQSGMVILNDHVELSKKIRSARSTHDSSANVSFGKNDDK